MGSATLWGFDSIAAFHRHSRVSRVAKSRLSKLVALHLQQHPLTSKFNTPRRSHNSAWITAEALDSKLVHSVSYALQPPADLLLKNPRDLVHPAQSPFLESLKDLTSLVDQWELDHAR